MQNNSTKPFPLSFLDNIASIYASNNYSIVTRTDSHEIGCDYMMLQNALCDGLIEVAKNNPNDDHIVIDVSDTKLRSNSKIWRTVLSTSSACLEWC